MDEATQQLIQSIPKEVWQQLYNDAPRPMLRQFGKFGEDVAKTIRLLTLPIQCTAYIQDRVDRGFAKAIEEVPEERRIVPPEGFTLDIADKFRHHDCETLIGQLYVDLLSASMDKDRVNKAHPAFLPIIGQLSPDEALLLLQASKNEYSVYVKKIDSNIILTGAERDDFLDGGVFNSPSDMHKIQFSDVYLKTEAFHFVENLPIYVEHLCGLTLLETPPINQYGHNKVFTDIKISAVAKFIKMTSFGRLFFECCSASLKKTEQEV
ncbi:DUF4393 domain-containing protein [Raoultella ornithinolytica]|uniref:Abi-alpha family protein n=1 Tax=Raoultella ornithinolytica TaxID=54291 RepID=UPI000FDA2DD2|nr:Abi-alpha family protein [Raoultella ornithinolytica]MEB5728200.1 DUF4393 domain-containing protein [Raoultella ornithinolytica]RVS12192.1 DUF4393 domain-containing protein [Raoultella ornithinolytica]THE44567.1 hypothetical protein DJ495_06400 [Raoultella ornithinolytica]